MRAVGGDGKNLVLKTTVLRVSRIRPFEIGLESVLISWQARNLAAKDKNGTSDPVILA